MSASSAKTALPQALTQTLRASRKMLWPIVGLTLLCNLGVLAVPAFNMVVFTTVLPTRDLSSLSALSIGLLIGLMFWSTVEFLRGLVLESLATCVVTTLSLPCLQAAAHLRDGERVGSQCLADLETLRLFLSSRACLVPFDLALAPILLGALVILHWSFGVFACICIFILAMLNWIGDFVSRHVIVLANRVSANALRDAADAVNSAGPALAMGMLPRLNARWMADQQVSSRLVQNALLRVRAIAAANAALRSSMTGAMVALGLLLALNGFASSASMVGANMILARLLMPFTSLAGSRRQWSDVISAGKRLSSVLKATQTRRYDTALPSPSPRLVIENLSFVAPGGDRPLLRSISFTVEPGESIAILGPSSSGKSTLIKLIVGMSFPTTGGVYLDGTNAALWEREDFARHVGFVPQRPMVLDETVADNISRMQEPDLAKVIRVAKATGLHRTILTLPQGYDTIISGAILSGGQRQRLALARAMYTDPMVLVLDEPSASLDAEGETQLLGHLANLKARGVTIVLTTHRPSLLALADKIAVLQNGTLTRLESKKDFEASVQQPSMRLIRSGGANVSVSV